MAEFAMIMLIKTKHEQPYFRYYITKELFAINANSNCLMLQTEISVE